MTMKKKYRSLVLIPVILLCTLFGCRKEKAELLFEDTEKIIEEDPADLSGDSKENQKAGRSVESGELMLENSDRNTLEESDTGKLHVVEIDGCPFNRNFSLVYHKNKYFSEHISSFADTCRDFLDVR